MTLQQRVDAFQRAFPKWPASWPRIVREGDHDVLYAIWVMGNDYRTRTKFYGAYPHGYLKRVMALFPDAAGNPECPRFDPDCDGGEGDCHDACEYAVLHAFSGSVPLGPYVRLDANPEVRPDRLGSVYQAGHLFDQSFSLVLADPPYSKADAEKYGTPMVDRRRALAGLADVTAPGGHLVWLDVCWPMHRKAQWRTVGRILLQRSTNHRVRLVSIFERVV